MIKAAGAIIWREKLPFELEVLVIHRPQYDDWSFPKGKVDEGEAPIAAAFREVKEETGIEAIFGQYLERPLTRLKIIRRRLSIGWHRPTKRVPHLLPMKR